MVSDYGKTWWGHQWLNSLSHIDYSNRLPRGRSYAHHGYVREITIDKNNIYARVQGSRRTPYKVRIMVPRFSETQKKKLMAAINADPLLLSYLLNRELPPALNKIAEDNGINIFPSSWRDFRMNCSCPDWAVPCKHLAAVIYILSAEIDKNPFLIFQLHGLDILHELEKTGLKGRNELQVPRMAGFFRMEPDTQITGESSSITSFDLSVITPMMETLFSLLDEKPLFFGRAFIPVLRKKYKACARKVRNIYETEREEFPVEAFEKYDEAEIIFHNEAFYFDTVLFSDNDEKHFPRNRGGIKDLCIFLDNIPGKYINRLSPSILGLYKAYHFSLKLLETGGFIPQLLELSDGSYIIRWIPATGNENIEKLLSELELNLPAGFVKVKETPSGSKYFVAKEQVNTLVSMFISFFVNETDDLPTEIYKTDDKIEMLFFSGKAQKFDELGEKEIPGSIHQWLSRFYIVNKDYVPLIKVEDNPEKNIFKLDLLIENRKNSLQGLIPLKDFLNDEKYIRVKPVVLQSLASLSRDFPDMGKLISSQGGKELYYNASDFARVLLEILPVIKLLGIRILLPGALKSLARPHTSVMLKEKADSKTDKKFLSLDKILDFEWRVAIGDQTVKVCEFKELVKGMSGIVNIKGQYVLIDQSEINTLLGNLDRKTDISPGELLQAVLTEEYREAKISITDEAKRIIRNILDAGNHPLPEGLKVTLRPYQERGFQWLYKNATVGFGSIIADDMGLGKTLQVIVLLLQLKDEGRLEKQKALIVVPTTLITNWQKEIERFAPGLSVHIYHGPLREYKTNEHDLMITSYGVLRSDISKFMKTKWAVVVVDEAQNIKNPGAEQTKAVKKLKAPVKIAMSGTPVENRLSEYWSIFDFVNKGYLGSLKYFKKEFATPIELDQNENRLNRFRKVTSPFILRRLKTDKNIISDLPDKVENDRFVRLTKEQAAIYQNVVDTMIPDVQAAGDNKIQRAGFIFKLMTALKQVCNHPSQFLKKEDYSPDISGKAAMLINLLQTIYENGEKVLVFTQYREMGKILVKMIEKQFARSPLFLHGGVPRKERDKMIMDFQEKRHIKIFILSIKAGGTGLNLTEANNVIHYDLWWNPAVEAQATDRAFRIGQKKNVMVYRLITRSTFEERINEMLQQKKKLANLTVSSGEKWVGDLSDKDITELIKLGS